MASFLNLLLACLDGLGFWMELPLCQLFGCCRATLLVFSSLLVALVCSSRCIAVCNLNLYKRVNKTAILCAVSSLLLLLSLLFPIFMTYFNLLRFKYIGPPSHIGCSLILRSTGGDAYMSFAIFFIFICDVVLLMAYTILYHKLHHPSLRPSMNRLKASARKVSLIITLMYLILHLPIVVVYMAYTFQASQLITVSNPTNKLILDFLLRFLSYLYSAVLPTIIVKTGSVNQKTLGAAKNSVNYGNNIS